VGVWGSELVYSGALDLFKKSFPSYCVFVNRLAARAIAGRHPGRLPDIKSQIDLPLKSLFESPRVAEMAGLITEGRATNLSGHELHILRDLESMSDEQAQKFLSELGETKPRDEVRDE
jgi:hypothetical protein